MLGVILLLLVVTDELPLGAVAHAQMKAFECAESATIGITEAQGYLSRTQKAYEQVTSLQAEFSQDSYLAALAAQEQSKGSVLFVKPGRMKWEYSEPEPQMFLIDGKTFWLYQPKDRQVIIDVTNEVLLSDLPVAFLMGIGALDKDFTLEHACRTSSGFIFRLVPKGAGQKDNQLAEFSLLVDGQDFLPRGGKTRDVGGNITALVLSRVKPNVSVADGTFEPEFPVGVDVQDRRTEPKGASAGE